MSTLTKIQLDPNILCNPRLNEDHLWFLIKIAQLKINYTNTFPKVETLMKWTKWGKNKVIKVSDELVEMRMLSKEYRFKKTGGNSSNIYRIKTNQIKLVVEEDLESEMEDENIENIDINTNVQKSAGIDQKTDEIEKVDGVSKSNPAVFENQTQYKGIYNSLNATSISKNQNQDLEELNKFVPNEMYSQTIARTCPDLDQLAIDIELLLFKTYYQKNIPENINGKFLKWCQNSNEEYRKRKNQTKINDKDLELKDKRIQDYHEKKMDNIAKIGTQSNFKTPYSPPLDQSRQPASFDIHPQLQDIDKKSKLDPIEAKKKLLQAFNASRNINLQDYKI